MASRRVGYLVTFALAATMLPALLLSPGCDPCPSCAEATKAPPRTTTRTPTSTPTPAPPSAFSQGLIAIDTNTSTAYVPIYSLDGGGNAQVEVVSGSGGGLIRSGPATASPALSLKATITLLGAIQPVGGVFDPVTKDIFIEARDIDSSKLSLYQINPGNNTVINTIALTGMSHDGLFGGLLADPARKQLVVAGSFDLATVDVSKSPPAFNPSTLEPLETCTDSIAINPNTGMLFISCDGNNAVQSVTSLSTSGAPQSFISLTNGCCTDGVAFDPGTNIVALTQEVVAARRTCGD